MKNFKKFNFMLIFSTLILFILSCQNNESNSTQVERTNIVQEEVNESQYIEGIIPGDIYLNLEKIGFKTERASDQGNFSWSCKLFDNGIEYRVDMYSEEIDKVESIVATVYLQSTNININRTYDFLKYIGSVPYDSSEPQRSASWIKENFNKKRSSIIIGDAEFIILAPSQLLRTLRIHKS